MTRRFAAAAVRLGDLSESLLVRCPRCDGCAVVRRDPEVGARLACEHCALSAEQRRTPCFGSATAVVRERCVACGARIDRRFESGRPGPRTRQIECAACGTRQRIALAWQPVEKGAGRDPYFHLPLWLCRSLGGNLLWLYNERHLAFVEGYVAAGLRERAPDANGALASRLPRWLKAAARRETILRALAELRSTLPP